jgi:hypothetical protein
VDLDVLAVAVSVASFALSGWLVVSQRWAKRKAFIEVRLESFPRPAKDRPDSRGDRLVLVNHGPAVARRVSARLFTPDGEAVHGTFALAKETLPIPVLWPGQDFHMQLRRVAAEELSHAEITWRDHRLGQQSATTYLTDRYV